MALKAHPALQPASPFPLSQQPFVEGGSEYPVGHVSLLGVRLAAVVS